MDIGDSVKSPVKDMLWFSELVVSQLTTKSYNARRMQSVCTELARLTLAQGILRTQFKADRQQGWPLHCDVRKSSRAANYRLCRQPVCTWDTESGMRTGIVAAKKDAGAAQTLIPGRKPLRLTAITRLAGGHKRIHVSTSNHEL
jgi:hypothetical protein